MASALDQEGAGVITPRSRTPEQALLVASVMGRSAGVTADALSRAEEEFGRLMFISEPLQFGWSRHHRDELGERPERNIVAFDQLGDASRLPEIKRTTCRMEIALGRKGGRREVNIDPGFLGEHQLIFASTCPREHCIHIGKGIYGELVLLRGAGGFEPLPWTTPDYAAPEMRQIFAGLSGILLEARQRRRHT